MNLKTGKDYRYMNKVRVQKHRKEMKAKGYIAKTVFLSNRFQDEINSICKEHRLAQHEALDLILDGYIKSQSNSVINVNDNVTHKTKDNNFKLSKIPISEFFAFDDDAVIIPEIEISDDDTTESVRVFEEFLAIATPDIKPENDL
ncbi:MAG: hypothetical protein HQK67_12955 [Desulfamplus sp.]|nr:hypothetical protein [Desulfamplus sp.]